VSDHGGVAGFLVVAAICVAIAAVAIPWLLANRRREELAVVAARHGLEYSHHDPFGCTRVAFPLFRKGDGRIAEDVMWREQANGQALRGFDFSYYDESRDGAGNTVRSYRHFTCVMAQVDGAWPEVSISREGILEKALGLVGLGDIELESEEFNRRFALRSPDRRFAVTLVDARMIDFLLSTEAQFAFFVKGRWLLLVSEPVSSDMLPALMRLGEAFVQHIPRVVYELWPSPLRDAEGRPLAVGDDGYGAALAAAELAEGDPWTVVRSNPYETMEADGGPQYDLDGNLVEPQIEDPWGRRPRQLPE
jgi:hypothetical protein